MINSFIRTEKYPLYKKILTGVAVSIIVATLIMSYISHVKIDEGTTKMYETLKTIWIVCLSLLPIAVGIIAFLIVCKVKYDKFFYSHRRKSKLNKKIYAFDIFNFVWMGIFCLLCIYPIFYVIIGSFNQGADYAKGGVYILPRLFTFENYRVVLKNQELWHSYLITFLRTLIGTLSSLLFTSVVAYAMSRENLKGRTIFYWINIFTMFFGGGLIPYFLIIKMIGLYNSFWVYIIPGLYGVYNMIVIQSFFKGISNELHEAALMDGAGEFRIWLQIYMPLSKPVLATVALWNAIGHWNSYFDTMIYTADNDLVTLQYFLLKAIQTSTMTEGMSETMMMRVSAKTISLAAIIISIIPVLFFFPFVRKNFQSGIMVGSLKG